MQLILKGVLKLLDNLKKLLIHIVVISYFASYSGGRLDSGILTTWANGEAPIIGHQNMQQGRLLYRALWSSAIKRVISHPTNSSQLLKYKIHASMSWL